MRKHRWLGTSLGLALLLTTVASTTYAYGPGTPDADPFHTWICTHFPRWCDTDPDPSPGPGPSVSATPELDSLLLFGFGLSGLGGYAVTRFRARRRT
jgi:hypothetical protein